MLLLDEAADQLRDVPAARAFLDFRRGGPGGERKCEPGGERAA